MLTLNKVDSRRCDTSSRWAALSRPRRFVRRAAMAKSFVTGATGFIGGRVTRQLVDAGQEVGAIARNPERAGDLVSLGVDVHPGDIRDPDSLHGPMAGVDGVFHIAGWYKIGSKDSADGERINVAGTPKVVDPLRELGIPQKGYTSTPPGVSPTPRELVGETIRRDGPCLTRDDRTKRSGHYHNAVP